ncbi:MAG: peptidoglycan DD-metalloendopeptidase family protein [Bdellovibrionota bacterium]
MKLLNVYLIDSKRVSFLILLPLLLAMSCAQQEVALNKDKLVWEEHVVKQGETLSQLVESWQVPNPSALLASLKENKQTVLRTGQNLRLHKTLGPVETYQAIEFPLSQRISRFFRWENGNWHFNEVEKNFTEKVVKYSGTVETTLWASAEKSGMDVQLLIRLSEIFAWVIDFSREIQVGDEWRLVAIQYVDGKEPKGWKDITVAEVKRGSEIYQAFLYEDPNTGRKGFFNANGESLEKLFLKSPIKFGRVTSRFNRKRFHPILGVKRPHLGVDYGAATGTPVMAIGDGVVNFAAWSGGGGRIVKIRHNPTYTTAYKHLSRFASGIRPGKKVHQGDIIGYVGSTGLSTGPHLHFEFLKNGSFVDPQRLKFPAATPLANEEKAGFENAKKTQYALVPNWPSRKNIPMRTVSSTE